jgi:hypothetical protein
MPEPLQYHTSDDAAVYRTLRRVSVADLFALSFNQAGVLRASEAELCDVTLTQGTIVKFFRSTWRRERTRISVDSIYNAA